MIQNDFLGHLSHSVAVLQFVFVRRRASFGVLRATSVDNFKFLTSSLKLKGQLLLFFLQNISTIKRMNQIVQLKVLPPSAAIGGAKSIK